MALGDNDALVGPYWGIDIDGITIKAIQEVSGLKQEVDVIEVKSNTADGKYTYSRLPGRPKGGELTLTRGMRDDKSFQEWMTKVEFGDVMTARKNGSVILYDTTGASEIRRYNFTNAFPKSLEITAPKAGSTDVITEKLTVVFEELKPA